MSILEHTRDIYVCSLRLYTALEAFMQTAAYAARAGKAHFPLQEKKANVAIPAAAFVVQQRLSLILQKIL